jgi:hypothetical protein
VQRACPYAHYNQLSSQSIVALHHIAARLAAGGGSGGWQAAASHAPQPLPLQQQLQMHPAIQVRECVRNLLVSRQQRQQGARLRYHGRWMPCTMGQCDRDPTVLPDTAGHQCMCPVRVRPNPPVWLHPQQAPQTARILLPGVASPSQVLPAYLQAQRQHQQRQQDELRQQRDGDLHYASAQQQEAPPPAPAGIAAANGNALAAYKRASSVASPPPSSGNAGGAGPAGGGVPANGDATAVTAAGAAHISDDGAQLPMAGRVAASLPIQQGRPALTLQVHSIISCTLAPALLCQSLTATEPCVHAVQRQMHFAATRVPCDCRSC